MVWRVKKLWTPHLIGIKKYALIAREWNAKKDVCVIVMNHGTGHTKLSLGVTKYTDPNCNKNKNPKDRIWKNVIANAKLWDKIIVTKKILQKMILNLI